MGSLIGRLAVQDRKNVETQRRESMDGALGLSGRGFGRRREQTASIQRFGAAGRGGPCGVMSRAEEAELVVRQSESCRGEERRRRRKTFRRAAA